MSHFTSDFTLPKVSKVRPVLVCLFYCQAGRSRRARPWQSPKCSCLNENSQKNCQFNLPERCFSTPSFFPSTNVDAAVGLAWTAVNPQLPSWSVQGYVRSFVQKASFSGTFSNRAKTLFVASFQTGGLSRKKIFNAHPANFYKRCFSTPPSSSRQLDGGWMWRCTKEQCKTKDSKKRKWTL